MNEGYGAQSMTAPLRRVVMRRPGAAMAAADPARWHYASAIDLEAARAAHDAFADALRGWDVEVLYHEEPLPDHADSVFVFDPALVTDRGTHPAQHGQGAAPRRGGTSGPHAAGLRRADLRAPRRRCSLRGRRHHVARPRHARCGPRISHQRRGRTATPRAARSARRHGARLRPALLHRPRGLPAPAELHQPGGRGSCRRLSVAHADRLLGRAQIAVACVCSRSPRRSSPSRRRPTCSAWLRDASSCWAGVPSRKSLLEESGCEVVTIPGEPLSFKTEGGPTCLTRPVWRQAE